LRRLVQDQGWDPSAVVVAGDTLNDLSMFEAGFSGVVVGSAEPALVERVRKLPHTYIAAADGCGGILEGLVHHGALVAPRVAASARGAAELVMVYHRLPFDEAI